MTILNATNHTYKFNFPINFIYKDVQDRYKDYLKIMPISYDSVTDYLNSSIQSITFNGIAQQTVNQFLNEDPIHWKTGLRPGHIIEKEFTVTFKNYSGYINYWIMYDQFLKYLSFENKDEYLPNVQLSFLNLAGVELLVFEFKQIIMTSISELQLNFSSNTPEFQTFTCGFRYNYFEIKRNLD